MTDETATSVEVECVYDNGCGKPEGECAVTCKAVLDAVAMAARKNSQTGRPFGDRHGPTPEEGRRMFDVKGRCPACNGSSLFLGSGGHVTCSRLDCPDPTEADELLHRGLPEPRPAATQATGARQCPCSRQPDPGICPTNCGPGRPAGGHCTCVHEAEQPARTTPNNPPTSKETP